MPHVRFGSQADMCGAPTHVRFTPNSDHKSRHAQMVMSALPLKADMCGALAHVRFGPIADIWPPYSIASSAMEITPGGMVMPSALAVVRLMTNSNLVDCNTGRSEGLAPLRTLPL